MDDREPFRRALLDLTREYDLKIDGKPIHHKTGIDKLKSVLEGAGLEIEVRELELEHDAPLVLEGADAENREAARTMEKAEDKIRKDGGTVEVIVMVKNVHVRSEDLGAPKQEMSVKLFFKERHHINRATAERLAGRGQVEIIG